MSEMPSPPFPNRESQILELIVDNTRAMFDRGELDVNGAIAYAAVHAWYEGHIEGEDVCPGCSYRGGFPKFDRQSMN